MADASGLKIMLDKSSSYGKYSMPNDTARGKDGVISFWVVSLLQTEL